MSATATQLTPEELLKKEKAAQREAEFQRRVQEEAEAEQRKLEAEKQRRIEEEVRRKKEEELWKRYGSDVIVALPPPPPSIIDETRSGIVKSWYLDDEVSEPALRMVSLKEGRRIGAPKITLSALKEIGISYYQINLNDFNLLNSFVKERKYKHMDEIKVSQTCKDEVFMEKWFQEHFHEDEQLRLVTDGSYYLDVRSRNDQWIRIHMQAGDCVVVPGGMFHRGCLDEDDYCCMLRIFKESQGWSPLFRSITDNHPARHQYLKDLKRGNVAKEMGIK